MSTAGNRDEHPNHVPEAGRRRASSNGQAVSSGLARKRRNPVLAAISGVASAIVRFLTKDWLATFLLVASIALVVTFFVLLASLSPGRTGPPAPLSRVYVLAQQHQIADAILLDHDSRVIVDTFARRRFYASYPSSGSFRIDGGGSKQLSIRLPHEALVLLSKSQLFWTIVSVSATNPQHERHSDSFRLALERPQPSGTHHTAPGHGSRPSNPDPGGSFCFTCAGGG